MSVPTPRMMQSALTFLVWQSGAPSDIVERIESVPLSEMTRGQACTLVQVATLYGWDGE